jgi:hypothetical protein
MVDVEIVMAVATCHRGSILMEVSDTGNQIAAEFELRSGSRA